MSKNIPQCGEVYAQPDTGWLGNSALQAGATYELEATWVGRLQAATNGHWGDPVRCGMRRGWLAQRIWAVRPRRPARDLDAAALKWSSHHPVRYTYTLGVGSGPFGSSSVRVKVVDGQCVAKTRFEFGRHKSRWKKCPCDGFMMEDVFARLRKGLEGKPSDFTADYDPGYGYVKRASVDPDAKLQDVDWGYYMKSFKVTK